MDSDLIKMELKLARQENLCKKLVMVDGLPGCGKTMLSSVINSLNKVEHFNYSYEIERICEFNFLKKIDHHSSKIMIKSQMDLLIYNKMMSREVNFRFSDLSSVLNSKNKWVYFKRLFSSGDEIIPQKIIQHNPILHIATHCLTAFSKPLILSSLSENMLLINLIRNPLYMIKQNMWNMENLIGNPRHFNTYYEWEGQKLPYFFLNQERKMIKATSKEKAIFFLEWARKQNMMNDSIYSNKNFYQLTFESFVSFPYKHLDKISSMLDTSLSKETNKALKKEKIPRKKLSDGRNLSIYKRVGWEKSNYNTTEEEKNALYDWITTDISKEAKKSIDWLIEDYYE